MIDEVIAPSTLPLTEIAVTTTALRSTIPLVAPVDVNHVITMAPSSPMAASVTPTTSKVILGLAKPATYVCSESAAPVTSISAAESSSEIDNSGVTAVIPAIVIVEPLKPSFATGPYHHAPDVPPDRFRKLDVFVACVSGANNSGIRPQGDRGSNGPIDTAVDRDCRDDDAGDGGGAAVKPRHYARSLLIADSAIRDPDHLESQTWIREAGDVGVYCIACAGNIDFRR